MSSTQTIVDAGPPFSPPLPEDLTPAADIILRSCDGVDFHAHKDMLSYSSQFFRDMLSFPEPTGANANVQKDRKPLVDLSESSKTIEKFLLLCYPCITGKNGELFTDLDGVDGAYRALDKYQVNGGQERLEKLMAQPEILGKQPHRVYAIACHRGRADLAKAAAVEMLKFPFLAQSFLSVPEINLISTEQYLRFQTFRDHCIAAVNNCLDNQSEEGPATAGDPKFRNVWWGTRGHSPGCGATATEHRLEPAKWFYLHVESIRDRTCSIVDVKAIADLLCKVEGAAFDVMAQCPECVQRAPSCLRWVSEELAKEITAAHSQILLEYSFVE